MNIYKKSKLVARTFIEQLNILFNMGKQLEGEVDNYSQDISDIKEDIETINGDIDIINDNIDSINGDIDDIQEDISDETTNRENADIDLQSQIDAITASSDVKDIVGTYAELQSYDTSTLGNNDIIKVLQDSTHNNASTYYRWSTITETFTYIGEEGPYYTKSEVDADLLLKANVADLSQVAFSGDYDDLLDKPTIPAAQVNSDWNSTSGVSEILNKPDISKFVENKSTNRGMLLNPSNETYNNVEGSIAILGQARSYEGIAIGRYSIAAGTQSIQLGRGYNTEDKSFYVCFGSTNWKILDDTGIFPDARLPTDIARNKSTGGGVIIGSTNSDYYETSNTVALLGQARRQLAIAIGHDSIASGVAAIQIGIGSNSENYSLKVGFGGTSNYKLLDSTGKIPTDRINIDTQFDTTYVSQNPISNATLSQALRKTFLTSISQNTDNTDYVTENFLYQNPVTGTNSISTGHNFRKINGESIFGTTPLNIAGNVTLTDNSTYYTLGIN